MNFDRLPNLSLADVAIACSGAAGVVAFLYYFTSL